MSCNQSNNIYTSKNSIIQEGVKKPSEKLKVVWLCGFSNEMVHNQLKPKFGYLERLIRLLTHRPTECELREVSNWVTNGIREFEKFTNEVELHVLAPYSHLSKSIVEFDVNGIHYHFINNEFNSLFKTLYRRVTNRPHFNEFARNRAFFKEVISKIQPDIVHVIGAECPNYSLALLDVPPKIPTIAQMQTLMSDPNFESSYCLDHDTYVYRASKEKEVIQHAMFVGTKVKAIAEMIKRFAPNTKFINTTLALTEPVDLSLVDKEFDFVYFSKEVEKAGDYAVEAFARAFLKHPGITLDIVGACSAEYKERLLTILRNVGAADYVTFEGALPTHSDVIKQIRKSRFAVIPMKIDMLTGTVRESMANGIPVCTTITPASPNENVKRESLLLSEKGDFQAMADNMCRLLEKPDYAERIRQNAALTFSERNSNEDIMRHWIVEYNAILAYCTKGDPLPKELITEV